MAGHKFLFAVTVELEAGLRSSHKEGQNRDSLAHDGIKTTTVEVTVKEAGNNQST